MVFSRLFFIYLFFPICFLCYFATKKTSYRNAVLIVFSLLFYACGDLSFLWLVVASALVNFVLGRGIERFRDKTPAKLLLALGLVLNLGTLVGFKYTGFFIENLNHWFSVHPCSRSAAAAWHQLFHVPHGFLSHRLRLGQVQVGTELFHIPAVRFVFPHHHFRTYRTI